MVAIDRPISETQRWAYPLLLVLSGVALGVSGPARAAVRHLRERTGTSRRWPPPSSSPSTPRRARRGAGVGQVSDVVGRKPVLLGALVALLVGLGVFLIADSMAMLLLARAIHGAAVGSIVVAGAAALLDLRPDHGRRSGQLSGVASTSA